jgi:glycine hydroxymethyltransferase
MKRGHVLATGGTDNHLMLWNVRQSGLSGSKMEKVLELASITVNKNSIPGDTSALNPGGVRLGTPALTTRGLNENDFDQVAMFLHRGYQIALHVQELGDELNKKTQNTLSAKSNDTAEHSIHGKRNVTLRDFQTILDKDRNVHKMINELKRDVETFAKDFFIP